MTNEEKQRILEKLAYNCWEIYGYKTNAEFNWKKAEEALKVDQEVNGEDFLLRMIYEK